MKDLLSNTRSLIVGLLAIACTVIVVTPSHASPAVYGYHASQVDLFAIVPACEVSVPEPTVIDLQFIAANDPKPDNTNYQVIRSNSLKLFIKHKI